MHLQCRRPQFDSCDRKILWRKNGLPTPVFLGFLCGSAGKEFACNVGDLGLIPGWGRSPGEGKGYPLQCSGLENSMDCIVLSVAKCWTRLRDFHFIFSGPRPMCGIAGSYDSSMSCISWKLDVVFHHAFTIYIPKKIVGGFHFPCILCRCFILLIYLICTLCRSFWWWPHNQCEVIPYCSFDWHWFNNYLCGLSFHVLLLFYTL